MYLMILDGNYPQDIRVRKEAESLAESGRQVTVMCRWRKNEQRTERINGVEVVRIGKNHTFSRKGISDILISLTWIDRTFRKHIRKLAQAQKLRVIHIHDLPLVKTALVAIRGHRSIALVLDMHENFPEMLEEYEMSNKALPVRLKDRLFFNVPRWKRYEKKVINIPDKIIAVVDEMKAKLMAEYGIAENKIEVISNYEKKTFQTSEELDNFNFEKDVFYLAYVGGISPIRGLDTVIRALSVLKSKNFRAELLIIGSGNTKYVASLQQLAIPENLEHEIKFLGYKKFAVINYYMKSVNLNIIPHMKTPHTDHTIPHKLFQILQIKAPLIVSNCNPLKRIVEGNLAGFMFKASDHNDLAEKIIMVSNSPELAKTYIENGYKLVYSDLNWEKEAQKLVLFYDNIYG